MLVLISVLRAACCFAVKLSLQLLDFRLELKSLILVVLFGLLNRFYLVFLSIDLSLETLVFLQSSFVVSMHTLEFAFQRLNFL